MQNFKAPERDTFFVSHELLDMQSHYQKLGFDWGDFPNSEDYYKKAISLPMFPTLTADEQSYVVKTVKKLCDE